MRIETIKHLITLKTNAPSPGTPPPCSYNQASISIGNIHSVNQVMPLRVVRYEYQDPGLHKHLTPFKSIESLFEMTVLKIIKKEEEFYTRERVNFLTFS